MNITDRNSTAVTRFANPLALGRFERTFKNLAALVHARGERRAALVKASGQRPAGLTRSEVFRQMQHEKWLGKSVIQVAAAETARPKDLHRRVLQDPHA